MGIRAGGPPVGSDRLTCPRRARGALTEADPLSTLAEGGELRPFWESRKRGLRVCVCECAYVCELFLVHNRIVARLD